MKLASMTGFGRAQGVVSDGLAASVVVRSVNHKFLDIVVRTNTRDEMPELDAAVRSAVVDALKRGRVTVQVNLDRTAPQPVRVVVNRDAASSMLDQLAELELPDTVERSLGLGELLAVPGIVSAETAAANPEASESEGLRMLTERAVAELVGMRRREAEHLVVRIREDLAEVERFVDWFDPRAAGFREQILGRIQDRLGELLGSEATIDPDRIVQEAAILADRGDVSEELVRLRSHLQVFAGRLDEGGPVGRSLDFLCQEVLRELNTLGSNCRELGVAEQLVDAKAALERVREQVQNLE
jgi:uncharacterized protein (TIGR00255 family)